MPENKVIVVAFPIGRVPESDSGGAPQILERANMERTALDLAIVADELSLRISKGVHDPLTLAQVNRYKKTLVRMRALLAQLDAIIDQVRPTDDKK